MRISYALASGIAAIACTRSQAVTVAAPPASSGAEVSLQSATMPAAAPGRVPRWTELVVSLGEPIGTDVSAEGKPFRSTIADEVRASDGSVAVPAGAPVHGVVKIARGGKSPVLALDFVSIETVAGPAPVSTMLRGATHLDLPVLDGAYEPTASPFDALFSPEEVPGPIAIASPAGSVDGPMEVNLDHGIIHLPAGARLHVVLTKPLVLTRADSRP